MICCTLSILMSLFCISFYVKRKEKSLNGTYFYLLVNQIIDLCLCVITILNPDQNGSICIMQGFLEQFTSFLLIEWDFIIILKIYREIHRQNFHLKFSMFISIIISLAMASIPLKLKSYVDGDVFCSMNTKGDYPYLIFICFYIPFWICCIITVLFLYQIEKISKERIFDQSHRSQYLSNLRFFPASLAVCYFMLSLFRIIEVITQDSENFSNFGVVAICVSRSHGFINGIITIIIHKRRKADSIIIKYDDLDEISRCIIGDPKEQKLEHN